MGNLFTVTGNGEGCQAQVKANGLAVGLQWGTLHLHHEAGEVAASAVFKAHASRHAIFAREIIFPIFNKFHVARYKPHLPLPTAHPPAASGTPTAGNRRNGHLRYRSRCGQ